jgi:16S rRNA (adenine1518-N6/adenine1519-N6)-dimethyltransferase
VGRKNTFLSSFLTLFFIGHLCRFAWGAGALLMLGGLLFLLRPGAGHAMSMVCALLLVLIWPSLTPEKNPKEAWPSGALGWVQKEEVRIMCRTPFLLADGPSALSSREFYDGRKPVLDAQDDHAYFNDPISQGSRNTQWIITILSPQDLRTEVLLTIRSKLQALDSYAPMAELLLLGSAQDSGPLGRWYSGHGLGHLLALSGFHIGFYLVLFRWIFGRRHLWPLLIFLWSYLWLIGFVPSFVRAALMISLKGIAQALGKNLKGITVLGAAFLIQILLFPSFTPGFWLSYTAVLALTLFPLRIGRAKKLLSKLTQYIWAYTSVIGSLSLLNPMFPFLRFPLEALLVMPLATLEVTATLSLALMTGVLPEDASLLPAVLSSWLQALMGPMRELRWSWDLPPAVLRTSWLVFLGLYTKVRLIRRFWPEPEVQHLKAPIAYDSPGQLKSFLESQGLNTLKRWGQNFLINNGARQKIQNALDLGTEEGVWEIGPGLGAMTYGLLKAGHPVKAFEIDPAYADILENWYRETEIFEVVRGDVLRTWKEQVPPTGLPPILGNLPYNAASAIIADLIESEIPLSPMVITVQKEMAERMLAAKSTKAYSSFSILCQSAYSIRSLGDLRAGSFYPPPRVDSTILRLDPFQRSGNYKVGVLSKLVRGLFTSRRKTLKNNLLSAARALGMESDTLGTLMESKGFS